MRHSLVLLYSFSPQCFQKFELTNIMTIRRDGEFMHEVLNYVEKISIKNEATSDTASFHSGTRSGSDFPEQLQQQLKDGSLAAQADAGGQIGNEQCIKMIKDGPIWPVGHMLINQWILGHGIFWQPS